jgi:P4 family phage/plasmid primase-like protien
MDDSGVGYDILKDPPRVAAPKFSDQALALEFAGLHEGDLRYVAQWGQWRGWNGKLWELDTTLAAYDHVKKICREAANSAEKPAQKQELASAKTAAAVERLARSDRRMAITVEQFNSDPWLLNTDNGVVDLRTGKLCQHAPEFCMTKITTAPAAGECPRWMAFLERVTDGNAELIEFLQRYTGYCLTGSVREHVFAFLYGTGANGKSVFINTISKILGDYATTAPMEMLLVAQGERHPTDIAMLHGARLVTAQETQKGRRWDEARLTNLTGGDRLKGRFMRQDFFEFEPTHKLLMAGNDKPSLYKVDEGLRRRFLVVPFTVQIPPSERNLRLFEQLKDEHGGILCWMIEGCLKWQADGLQVPPVVREATNDYLAEQDVQGQWLKECVDVTRNRNDVELLQKLFASWQGWAKDRGYAVGTEKGLSAELAKTFEGGQHSRTRRALFRGLRLKGDATMEMELELVG